MSKEIERAIAFAEEYRKRLVSYIEFGEAKRGETKLNEWETILFSLQAQLNREKEPVGWIKCSDGLPEPYERVLVRISGVDVGYHNTVTWQDTYGDNWRVPLEHITHWMPLPKPPKEENHELLGNKPECV